MSYMGHFINEHKPLIKPRYVAVEEDLLLVHDVFPEPGFRSYFCGHIISKLAAELRKHGIKTYHDRESCPEFATLARVLSNVSVAAPRVEVVANDGRGIRSTCETSTSCSGVATDNESTSGGGSKESKDSGEEREEA